LEDPTAEEKLLALGYILQGNDFSKSGTAGQGTDPKDNIKVIQHVNDIGYFIQAKGADAAIAMLQQEIVKNPGIPTLYAWLGDCYRNQRKYDKAVSVLYLAVKLAPHSMIARIELGLALEQKGDFVAAIPEFEKAVATMPQSQEWRLDLANAYSHAGRLPEAERQYKEVLKINPENCYANLLLGKSLLDAGDAAASLASLEKAKTIHPEDVSPHKFLALAYAQLRKTTEAEQEEAKALSLEHRVQGVNVINHASSSGN